MIKGNQFWRVFWILCCVTSACQHYIMWESHYFETLIVYFWSNTGGKHAPLPGFCPPCSTTKKAILKGNLSCIRKPQNYVHGSLTFFKKWYLYPGHQIVRATKLCTVTPNISGYLVWNLFHVILLLSRIFRSILDFWQIYEGVFVHNIKIKKSSYDSAHHLVLNLWLWLYITDHRPLRATSVHTFTYLWIHKFKVTDLFYTGVPLIILHIMHHRSIYAVSDIV